MNTIEFLSISSMMVPDREALVCGDQSITYAEMAARVNKLANAMQGVAGLGIRLMGRYFMPEYPFEEAYFRPYARQFRAALEMPLVLLGGINRLDTIQSAMDEKFEFVAMARALLREPDLVKKLANGASQESLCVHCNKCMPTIYRGTHCVLATDAGGDTRPPSRAR